jgi:CRP/FNR family transcriptional regulator, cyclic AMP receptor protein
MSVTDFSKRAPALRCVPIFHRLPKATLFDVARKAEEVTYPPGAIVVQEGDPGDALYVIAEGTVEVHTHGRVVAKMTAGDFFGEISLFDGEPRSATIVAVDDLVLLKISSADYEALLALPYVARAALRSLAERVREAHDAHDP